MDQLEGEGRAAPPTRVRRRLHQARQCMLKSIYCEQMGFDPLGYQSLDGMLEAIGIDPEGVHVLLDRQETPEGRLPSAAPCTSCRCRKGKGSLQPTFADVAPLVCQNTFLPAIRSSSSPAATSRCSPTRAAG